MNLLFNRLQNWLVLFLFLYKHYVYNIENKPNISPYSKINIIFFYPNEPKGKLTTTLNLALDKRLCLCISSKYPKYFPVKH